MVTKALVAKEDAEWMPSTVATAAGAHGLTQALVTVSHFALREERLSGSDIPPELAADGEVNPAYEIILRERALEYLGALRLEAEASTIEILADICQRGLYLHHPGGWSSLSQFVRNFSEGKSDSYQSIVERFVSIVLPYLEQQEIMTIKEVMGLITSGGFSRIYAILAYLQMAVEDRDRKTVKSMMEDAGKLSKRELRKRYATGKKHVTPAPARLERAGDEWVLTIKMNGRQRRMILNRLAGRIDTEIKNLEDIT